MFVSVEHVLKKPAAEHPQEIENTRQDGRSPSGLLWLPRKKEAEQSRCVFFLGLLLLRRGKVRRNPYLGWRVSIG